jgi:uncharacterized RDD family membrane protein YckC
MFCTKCGKELLEDAKFCPACGTSVGGAAPAVNVAPVSATVLQPEPKKYRYGGFWIRFLAYIIDQLVIGTVMFVFVMIGLLFSAGSIMSIVEMAESNDPDPGAILGMVGIWVVFGIVSAVAKWLYYAFMESSASRGTLGKMALGLQVIDRNGQTISFGRATGRYFAKILSSMILMIGYIMAGFTAKKQALHDIICDTYVVKQRDTLDYE